VWYSNRQIGEVIGGTFVTHHSEDRIDTLVYDSRRVQQAASSLFFALKTPHNDGHKYITDVYEKGVRNFVVSEPVDPTGLTDATIIQVPDTLAALQSLAAFHRSRFSIPVIGITGSNGKTIVKEWLYQLLQHQYNIVRSPKSYNSQLGVPLSVWQMNEQHTLGIFEAGISMPGEMSRLEKIIQPTIGILTNIGEAHDANFSSQEEKLQEKLKLFEHTQTVIGPYELLAPRSASPEWFTWGTDPAATLQIRNIHKEDQGTVITASYKGVSSVIQIPFTDDASVQNAISCWCVLLYLNTEQDVTRRRFLQLHTVDMRLQLKQSINGCLVINDSYSADVTSLKIALDFLRQQSSGLKRTVILSEFFESGKTSKELYTEVAELLRLYEIRKAIVIGERISDAIRDQVNSSIAVEYYLSTEDFIREFKSSAFFNEIILIKGARRFGFERIAQLFEKKLHQTVLEINLNALAHNLKEYQQLLRPGTRVMAMVKAFSYGSGGAEIASVLQYHNTNYLGVAYADEGVELVKAGIRLPVMVMNAEESSFQSIVDYNLQPVIYSFDILSRFEAYLNEQGLSAYPVHLEIETGMNRLGFSLAETEKLARHIARTPLLVVQSVFSHLAASEDPVQDEFTRQQAQIFEQAISILKQHISYPFLKHISNSAAIVRHPSLQMDMVRLGIGLYGIEIDNDHLLDLQAVATLRSTIAQLKRVQKGGSVSYNRRGVVNRDSLIATIRIGYADGYSRQFSNGVGKVWVKGQLAPVIGTVCMDMTMIDVTDVNGVQEGDDVVIYGPQLPVQEVAGWIKTIPYELMTGVSQRVKRIYFHE
jgi:alanine racemase